MSFSEVRDYQYGDDVRNIDWNVTARTGDPHVKIFEEERELTVMLLVDVSGSAFFGSTRQPKNALITEICAVLAFSAITNNDKVGVIFFSDHIERFIPPKKGKSHILRIIRELINFEPAQEGTKISMALEYFTNVIKKRSICYILSDFLCDNYETPLRVANRKHDIIGIRIIDPIEEEMPNVGLIRTIDAETGQQTLLDTSSRKVQNAYKNQYKISLKYFQKVFRTSGADTINLYVDQPYVTALHKFFKRRSSR